MGSSKKTTTSNTNSTSNFTTTPQMPGYASSAIEDYIGSIDNYGQSDPYQYVTPASSLQQQGFNAAGNLPSGAAGYNAASAATAANLFGEAPEIAAPTLGRARSVLDNFDSYLNPTTNYLVDRSLAAFDDDAGRQAAALQGAAARNGAFGGSRFAIQEAQQAADTSRNRGLLDAQLRNDAWNNAAGLSQFDISTQQQRDLANQAASLQAGIANASNMLQNRNLNLAAAGQLADITGAEGANARANLGSLLDAGNLQYALNDARTQAPLTQLQNYAGLLDPSLLGLITGQNVTGSETGQGTQVQKSSGGLLGKLASVAQIAGTAASLSDRRAKRDIELIGREPDGLGVYRFRYLWDAPDSPSHEGVMADEVATLRPWALGPEIGGYATVNYGAL